MPNLEAEGRHYVIPKKKAASLPRTITEYSIDSVFCIEFCRYTGARHSIGAMRRVGGDVQALAMPPAATGTSICSSERNQRGWSRARVPVLILATIAESPVDRQFELGLW